MYAAFSNIIMSIHDVYLTVVMLCISYKYIHM